MRADAVAPAATWQVSHFGDSCVSVINHHANAEIRWRQILALADFLRRGPLPGVGETIATYDSVLVEFDCTEVGHDDVETWVRQGIAAVGQGLPSTGSRRFDVPVLFDFSDESDLAEVAAGQGMSAAQFVDLFCATDLTIRYLGPPLMTSLIDGAPWPAPVPRRPSPRTSTPHGAVLLAARQVAVFDHPFPTGWRLIGRTPVRFFDRSVEPAVPYRPGDVMRFHPIDAHTFAQLHGRRLQPRDE